MKQQFILHHQISGSGSAVVLLPGMLGTTSFWEPLAKILAKTHQVICFDLLGFGHSPAPENIAYTLEDHIQALINSLNELNIKTKITLAGHSMGAIMATNFAAKYPGMVSKLILIAPVIFKTPAEAKENIAQHSSLPKILLYGPIAYIACHIFCKFLKPLTKIGVVLAFHNMPKKVAEDTLLHTWHSYSKTLEKVIENQNLISDIEKIKVPITIVYGKNDNRIIKKNIDQLKSFKNIKIVALNGENHQFPIYQPELLIKIMNLPTT